MDGVENDEAEGLGTGAGCEDARVGFGVWREGTDEEGEFAGGDFLLTDPDFGELVELEAIGGGVGQLLNVYFFARGDVLIVSEIAF